MPLRRELLARTCGAQREKSVSEREREGGQRPKRLRRSKVRPDVGSNQLKQRWGRGGSSHVTRSGRRESRVRRDLRNCVSAHLPIGCDSRDSWLRQQKRAGHVQASAAYRTLCAEEGNRREERPQAALRIGHSRQDGKSDAGKRHCPPRLMHANHNALPSFLLSSKGTLKITRGQNALADQLPSSRNAQ